MEPSRKAIEGEGREARKSSFRRARRIFIVTLLDLTTAQDEPQPEDVLFAQDRICTRLMERSALGKESSN
jgi:hypothetical protein